MALSDYQRASGASGLAGLFGGLFGDSGAPYDSAMDEFRNGMGQSENWMNKGREAQNPFYNAGTGAIPQYQDWLGRMKDPTAFINNIMGNYQQSPFAKYLTQQSMRAGTNAASQSGLTGSTPFIEQMQQNAGNIASGDMNQWLQNVLGINNTYGQGQQNLIGMGQNSANQMTNSYNTLANLRAQMSERMGDAAYGKEAGGQQDKWNTIGGIASLASMFL